MAAAALPASLKSIKAFLDRADELKTVEPMVAYHLRLYALQEAMRLRASLPTQDQAYIITLMDELERQKASLGPFDDAEVLVENYGQSIFTRADDADRAGDSSLRTAKCFLAASNVLEACKQFGELPVDLGEKIKYAKWRFVEIAKAIKEKREPEPPRKDPSFEAAPEVGDEGDGVPPPESSSSTAPPPSYLDLPAAQPTDLPPPPQAPAPALPASPPLPVRLVTPPSGRPTAALGAAVEGFKPERSAMLEAASACKKALSALSFQDSETAVHELSAALALLCRPRV